MTILLIFLRVAWPYLLGALLLGGVYYGANHWCNGVCRDARAERDTLKAEKLAAQKMAAAIATKYGEQVAATQHAEVQRDTERNARFVPVESAATHLPAAVAGVRFPAAAARVLNDAVNASNAETAKSAARAPESPATPAPDSDVASVTAWGVACAKQYAEVSAQVTGWQSFYSGLQHAQLAEELH